MANDVSVWAKKEMMLIYTKQKTERLQYICSHIFKQILGIDFQLCTDAEYFLEFQGYKLNYSDVPLENVFSIYSHHLLFEENIHPQDIEFELYEDSPICFLSHSPESALPFDVFAACFFFLSRYEEYLPHTEDVHQRYDVTNSLAYKHDFLHLAIVDRWIDMLKDKLWEEYPDMSFKEREFSFIPTYDIDLAFAYKQKGLLLNMVGFVRSFLKLDFKAIKERANVLLGSIPDPYDSFEYLSSLHEKYYLKPYYFFLVAQKRSRFDKNTSVKNKPFRNLIRRLSKDANIGLHTSYYVKDNPQKIDFEIACLQDILGMPIDKNRHHYLRFSLPESYQLLAHKNIKEEYSMGYVHYVGFRAGTCNSFYWFDLQENKTSNMQIFPLLFMENALLEKEASEVITYLNPFIEEIKQHNGILVSLFHNQSFGNSEKWKIIYERLLEFTAMK